MLAQYKRKIENTKNGKKNESSREYTLNLSMS